MRRLFIMSAACLAASCVIIGVSNDLLEVRSEDYDLEKGSSLTFVNTNGDLEVREWDNDFVRLETSIYGDSSKGVPEDLEINVEATLSSLDCVVDYPNGLSTCSVDFMVMIPKEAEMFISSESVNGETIIFADCEALVEAVNGDMDLDVKSAAGISTVNGDIQAVLREQLEQVEIETVNGEISLALMDGAGLDIETVNGDILYLGQEYDDELKVEGSMGTVIVSTVNGDISIVHVED